MKKRLAIICADEEQLPLVHQAKKMGVETHCFSWDKSERHTVCKGIADEFHPISILEKERILEVCQEINIDGVTSVWNDFSVPTVAFVAQNMGLPGNGYEDALVSINKYKARRAYLRNGVNSPQFAVVQEGQIPDLSGFRYPLIVKPTDGGCSVGVIKIERKEDVQEAIQTVFQHSTRKEAIIEEFITGAEVNVDSVSYNGTHYLLAITDRELATGFSLLAKHYPTRFSPEIQEKIKAETLKSLDAINFKNGAAGTQFIVTEAGEVLSIEINPRLSGSYSDVLLKLHNGYDIVKGIIDIALGQFEEPVFTDIKYSGLYYLCKETEWARQVIENKDTNPDVVEAGFYEQSYNKERKGYFIYQSKQRNFYH